MVVVDEVTVDAFGQLPPTKRIVFQCITIDGCAAHGADTVPSPTNCVSRDRMLARCPGEFMYARNMPSTEPVV